MREIIFLISYYNPDSWSVYEILDPAVFWKRYDNDLGNWYTDEDWLLHVRQVSESSIAFNSSFNIQGDNDTLVYVHIIEA